MTHLKSIFRSALAGAVLLTLLPSAYAQDQMTKQYSDMCVQSAKAPKPYGEWDLKGNAKLPAYCGCFASAFKERAMKSLDTAPPPQEKIAAEELAMRNTCRKQAGLPLAVADEMPTGAPGMIPRGPMAPKASK